MNKSPAFQFYAAEFLVDENVVLMTNQEVGCYIKLMAYCWREGSIPSDVTKIAKLCGESGMAEIWPNIAECFVIMGGTAERLVHPRLQRERDKQSEFKEKRSASGSIGASNKWGETPSKMHGKTRSERLSEARKKGAHTASEWSALVSVCGDACLRCGAVDAKLVKDHITPIYQDGSDGIENLQPICASCNSSKGPESIDFRPDDWKKCLANALQMHGSSSSSSISINKKQSKKIDDFLLPEWINKEHWDMWHQHPKRKKLSNEQKQKMVNQLEEWKNLGLDYAKSLKETALNGWQGIFEPKSNIKPMRGHGVVSDDQFKEWMNKEDVENERLT